MTDTVLFDLTFGVEGEDQVVLLTGVPVWEARFYAMQALDEEAARVKDREPHLTERLLDVRTRVQFAELGSIVFGHVERYVGGKDQPVFIAILPTGTDYRDAGYKPAAAFSRLTGRPTFTPTTEAHA
jgi:hypothetical protein